MSNEVSRETARIIARTNSTSKLNPTNQAAKMMLLSLLARYD